MQPSGQVSAQSSWGKFTETVSRPFKSTKPTISESKKINDLCIDNAVRNNREYLLGVLDDALKIENKNEFDKAIKEGKFKTLQFKDLESVDSISFTDTKEDGTKVTIQIIPPEKDVDFKKWKEAVWMVRHKIDMMGARANNGKTLLESESELEKLVKKFLAKKDAKKLEEITPDDIRKYIETIRKNAVGISVVSENNSIKVKYENKESSERNAVKLTKSHEEVQENERQAKERFQSQAKKGTIEVVNDQGQSQVASQPQENQQSQIQPQGEILDEDKIESLNQEEISLQENSRKQQDKNIELQRQLNAFLLKEKQHEISQLKNEKKALTEKQDDLERSEEERLDNINEEIDDLERDIEALKEKENPNLVQNQGQERSRSSSFYSTMESWEQVLKNQQDENSKLQKQLDNYYKKDIEVQLQLLQNEKAQLVQVNDSGENDGRIDSINEQINDWENALKESR